jgi:GH15 family glucan-1,4-alpha-glucosidase
MPRPLVFGNGRILLCLDDRYRIRDLFYPHVGMYNHLSGHFIRMGAWVDGTFSWVEADDWKRTFSYIPGTLTAHSILTNEALALRLECEDAVAPDVNAYVRRMTIHNLSPHDREVRLFFSQDLHIRETDIGDTAFYNPFLDGMVHYKGRFYFLFGGRSAGEGLGGYAAGLIHFGGHDGTWRDAEDGELSMNPIAQGSVDSTFALRQQVEANGQANAHYWILCASSFDDLEFAHEQMTQKGPDSLLGAARNFWSGWGQTAGERMAELPADVEAFCRQSLLIMRTQVDETGAILAANDSDIMQTNRATYSYCWPRDGALVATIFDDAGYSELSGRFFEFCASVLPQHRPILMQKYKPDGSVGASWHPWIVHGRPEVPFQEDESALVLHALAHHFNLSPGKEQLEGLYRRFAKPVADFIVDYRNPDTGLPLPSYDLWEERRGVHTFTVAAVVAGLRGAAAMAEALGDDGSSRYRTAADEVLSGLRKHFFDDQRGIFFRKLRQLPYESYEPSGVIDSAVLQVGLLGAVPPEDEMFLSSLRVIEDRLAVRSEVGGYARYEGDYYFRRADEFPGNPWIICTMWIAQSKILIAKSAADLEEPIRLLRWAMEHAAPTGVLPEQLHPLTGEHLSVSPLTWSHAEVVRTALDLVRKQHELRV